MSERPPRQRTAGETSRDNERSIIAHEHRIDALERRFEESARSQGERIGALELSNAKIWKVLIAMAAGGGSAGAIIAKLIGG